MVENLEKRSFRPIRVTVHEICPSKAQKLLDRFWQKLKKIVFSGDSLPLYNIIKFLNVMFSNTVFCVDHEFYIKFLLNILIKHLKWLENHDFTKIFDFFQNGIFVMKICFLGKVWSKTSKNEVSDRSELRLMRYAVQKF